MVFIGLAVIAPLGMSSSWVPANATGRALVHRLGEAWQPASSARAAAPAASLRTADRRVARLEQFGWRTAIAVMAVTGGVR